MTWTQTKTKRVKLVPATGTDSAALPDCEDVEAEEEPGVEELIVELNDSCFKRRIAHPKYERWKGMETLAMALSSREQIESHVVCTGLLYGEGEHCLYDAMKRAWLQEKSHRLIGRGNNYVPTIHVRDAAAIMNHLITDAQEQQYIIAVDMSNVTQQTLIKGIISELGEEYEPPSMTEEEATLFPYPEELTADLRFQCSEFMRSDHFPWKCKSGFVTNLPLIADEFCAAHNLRPMRILVTGPPGVGKTLHSGVIAEHYNIPHIQIRDLLGDTKEWGSEMPERSIGRKDKTTSKQGFTVPRAPQGVVSDVYRRKLCSNLCRFRGYVLDGYPRCFSDAESLFLEESLKESTNSDEELEEEQEEIEKKKVLVKNAKIFPDCVILLKAPDDYCINRLINAPADEPHGSTNSELNATRRINDYRANNDNEDGRYSLSDFFQLHSVEVLQLPVEEHTDVEDVLEIARIYIERHGRPNNFLPTESELQEKRTQRLKQIQENEEAIRRRNINQDEDIERKRTEERVAEEEKRLAAIKEHEEKLVEIRSIPLRQYLLQHVAPLLTDGLLEICQVLPEDPIDYLAEFLIKHSESA